MTRLAEWRPAWAVPPGAILQEVLQVRGMTAQRLADRVGRPVQYVDDVIAGRAQITAEMALRLEMVLDISAALWTNLDRLYQERISRQAVRT